ARATVPAMLRAGHGSIVNVAAKAGIDPPAGAAPYAASKAAALALMDSLAAELAGSGVRVNSVLPSIIDTMANRKAMPGADYARWPKPEEIARVILFLCSDDAAVISRLRGRGSVIRGGCVIPSRPLLPTRARECHSRRLPDSIPPSPAYAG